MARNLISGADSSSAAKLDANLKNVTVTEDTATGKVYLDVMPNTVGAGGSGTQYSEGANTTSAIGTISLWKQAGNTLTAITPSFPLPVYMATGSAASIQYAEGASSATFTGDIFLFEDPTNTASTVSKLTPLPVNVITVGSLPLPSGAATSAAQDTQTSYLATLSALQASALTALQSLSAFGFATATRQDTTNSYLASITSQLSTMSGYLASLASVSFATAARQDTQTSYLAPQSVFDHGSLINITTAALTLGASFTCKVGVLVKASVNNTARVWTGNSDVTAESTVTTDGFELAAGESIFIAIDSPSKIFLCGETSTAQRVSYTCL